MQRILVLQSLGVDRRIFHNLVAEASLPHEVVWDDQEADYPTDDVSVVVTVNSPVDKSLLARFPKVRMIGLAFTGYDSVDIEACRSRDIAVYNVPAYSTDSTAELAIGLTLSLLRKIPIGNQVIRSGSWKLDTPGTQLAGKTVGVIGTGAIGIRTAELFKAFRCDLIGWSRSKRSDFTDLGGEYLPKGEVFQRADVVSIHLPLNPETRGIIGQDDISRMKPGACLINTARGPIVDRQSLIRALKKESIRAGIDVFDREPLPDDDPLTELPGTVLTPHIAYRTTEALNQRAAIAVDNIRAFVDGNEGNRIV